MEGALRWEEPQLWKCWRKCQVVFKNAWYAFQGLTPCLSRSYFGGLKVKVEAQRAETSASSGGPQPTPLCLMLKFWGRADTLSPRKARCVHARIKTLSRSQKLVHKWNTVSLALSEYSLKGEGQGGGGDSGCAGKKPKCLRCRERAIFKISVFYDHFIKLSWSLIKMSEFPMKYLKISSTFHSKITHQQTICVPEKYPKAC